MKIQSRLPLLSSSEIPPLGPTFGPCPENVDDGSGELREVRAAEPPDTPSATRDILERAHAIHVSAMCPAAPGSTTGSPQPPQQDLPEKFTWSVRVLVQLILMFLRTPPTIKALIHPPNADTQLVPAIDDILKYAGAIDETDNRIFRKVDPRQMAQQRDTLLFLREIRKIFLVAVQCVDAGMTHVEQYLDGSARYIYTKLLTELGGDLLLQQDLQTLVDLVSGPIVAGQEKKKSNARAAALQQPGDPGTGTGIDTGTGTAGAGAGVHVTVSPPAPAVPVVTGPQPVAHVAGPRPAPAASGGKPRQPGGAVPRGGSRRKG